MNIFKLIGRTRLLHSHFGRWLILFLFMSGIAASVPIHAQKKTKRIQPLSVSTTVPNGYHQVGNTMLYYRQSSESIDVQGCYNGRYYGSTYSNHGYKVAMQVNDDYPSYVDCLDGTTMSGVSFSASIEPQGELARVCYSITNTNQEDVIVSLGTHADVMIGTNDHAPISRRIDTTGNTYGITMKDGNGAQLCVLFGSGLAGVTSVSDYWFGFFYLNYDPYYMVGNYSAGDYYMQENGSYDSGMGWCWKNRTIPAGSTVVFSYLIGVGEVNLEPNSSFEVTPDDPDGWNDLSRPHRLTLEGTYDSPAGLDGIIEYAVEDSEDWQQLTEMMPSGSTFNNSLVAMFDTTRDKHIIRFRTIDNVGNTTMLPSIEYIDVSFHQYSGITDKIYSGSSLYQEITCVDNPDLQVTTGNYFNNVNVGTASFCIEGIFPYTIGRKSATFNINPQPLSGNILLEENSFVYNGERFTPEWQFSNENYSNLESGTDYTASWSNNILPGTGKLTVSGKNNYTGSLSVNITIDKAQLRDELFTVTLPAEDITYDDQGHGASIDSSNGVGAATFLYKRQNDAEMTTTPPSAAGNYDIFLELAEGTLYYGRPLTKVGEFTIYEFNEEEWAILQTVLPELAEMGWSHPWDVSEGIKGVPSIQGLTIEKGRITSFDLSNQNLTGFPYSVLTLPKLHTLNLTGNKISCDIATATSEYIQNNPEFTSNVQELNLSRNKLAGNISVLANSLPSLTNLDASQNCLTEVSPAISPTVTTLNLSKQTIDGIYPLNLTDMSVSTITSQVPNILLYDHANQTYATDIALRLTTSEKDWAMTLACKNGQVTIPYVSEQNVFYGENGETLDVAVLLGNGTFEGSTFRISLHFDEGDSNFDGKVNILDLQTMLNYMFEEYNNKPYNFTASNLWKDGLINVQDAVTLVNRLLDSNVETTSAKNISHAQDVTNSSDVVYIADGQLILNVAEPVSAFDIIVANGSECQLSETLASAGFTCSVKQDGNQIHIVGYSLCGATISEGTNILGVTDASVITYSMLADSEANEIRTPYSATPTFIGSNVSNNRNTNEVYRIALDSKHSIVIDANGKKFLITEK